MNVYLDSILTYGFDLGWYFSKQGLKRNGGMYEVCTALI